MGGQWPATVVVVEPFAHLRVGHFPSSFAELADGFAEAGVHVEVLTTSGWAFDDGEMPRWLIHRYGLLASTAEKPSQGSRETAFADSESVTVLA